LTIAVLAHPSKFVSKKKLYWAGKDENWEYAAYQAEKTPVERQSPVRK
jgi:hypothetical protein